MLGVKNHVFKRFHVLVREKHWFHIPQKLLSPSILYASVRTCFWCTFRILINIDTTLSTNLQYNTAKSTLNLVDMLSFQYHNGLPWRLVGAKPLSEPMLEYRLFVPQEQITFSQMLIEIQTFSFKEMHFKMSTAKWQPFCLGLNVFMFDKTSYYNWTDSSVTVLSRRRFISKIQWNLYITTTHGDTSLPSGAHLGVQGPPRWAPEGRNG